MSNAEDLLEALIKALKDSNVDAEVNRTGFVGDFFI